MERPLYAPSLKPSIDARVLDAGEVELDTAALFSQVVIDKAALSRHIRRALQGAPQVTLCELCERQPLQQGLAELVAYLELAGEGFKSTIDEAAEDTIVWWGVGRDGQEQIRQARLPRVIFVR
jgi:hypothetical protein